MGIDFHGCPDAGVADGFGEGGQIEVWIIFMLDVIMGHVGMAKSVNSDIMGQTDFLADFPMTWLVLQLTPLPKGKLEDPQIYLCSRRMALQSTKDGIEHLGCVFHTSAITPKSPKRPNCVNAVGAF